MSDRRNMIDDFFEAVDFVEEVYEDNQERIDSLLGGDKEVPLGSGDMLASAEKDKDSIQLTVDTQCKNFGDVDYTTDEEQPSMTIRTPDDSVQFKLPDDCDTSSVSFEFNNGVMEIGIERGNGGDNDGAD